jgi:hypothetical protein
VVAVSAPIPGPPPTAVPGPGPVARVEAAVAELDQLDELPVAEHVARYDALHGTLSDALAAIDGV